MNDTYNVELLEIEKINLEVDQLIDKSYTTVEVDPAIRDISRHKLHTYMAGVGKEKINIEKRYPKDWIEAFKERWFPECLLRIYPVKYNTITINEVKYKAICPHIRLDKDRQAVYIADYRDHIAWLGENK